MTRRLILRHKLALGDTILFTGLCRDIMQQHPGKYELCADCHFGDLLKGNPYVKMVTASDNSGDADGKPPFSMTVSYAAGIIAAGKLQKIHMLAWYYRDFTGKTGIAVHPSVPKGDLYLLPGETTPPVPGRYWVIMPGGKTDAPVKMWNPQRWQKLIDILSSKGITLVQAGSSNHDCINPQLNGVISTVGKHSVRELVRLVAHADGVICGITGAMHMAACFDKPCVVIAGGREEPWWESYTNVYKAWGPHCAPVAREHRFLHTVGQLSCCQTKGCWKHRTVPMNKGDDYDQPKRRCQKVAANNMPACMEMIEVEHVLEAVMSYYERGEIPPIGQLPKSNLAAALKVPPEHAVSEQAAGKLIKLPGFGLDKPAISLDAAPLAAPAAEPIQKPVLNLGPLHHPQIGGRFTVFVLCYGDYPQLAKDCIGSILATLPPEQLDLRIGLNAASDATKDYIKGLGAQVTKIYDHPENAKKYPVMREMFNDPQCPIRTNYVVWFDDDAKIVDTTMWTKLAETIVLNHPHGSRLYGWPMMHDIKMFAKADWNPFTWFKAATWWRGRNLRVRSGGQTAPNGSIIDFAVGWFWCLAATTIRDADIPDQRLNHNGGDATIGAQVQQTGAKIKEFNSHKKFVWCPTKEQGGRRGYAEAFPWSSPEAAKKH